MRCEERSSLDFYCTKLQKGFLVQSGLLSKWDKGSLGDPDILNLSWENGIQFIMSAWASRLRFLLYNSVRFSSVMSACCSSNAVSEILQKKKKITSFCQFNSLFEYHFTQQLMSLTWPYYKQVIMWPIVFILPQPRKLFGVDTVYFELTVRDYSQGMGAVSQAYT